MLQQQDATCDNDDGEDDDDIYSRKPELLATERPIRKLLAYDWSNGFVSPFRPSPKETLYKIFNRLKQTSEGGAAADPKCILDLGCGDGEVLIAALKFFSDTKVIGVELDEKLLLVAHENLQKENLRNRALLFCADFLSTEPLRGISNDSEVVESKLSDLFSSVDYIFLYLLPEALRKLIPMLTKEIQRAGVTVISMQWEALGLEQFLVLPHDPLDGYYLYRKL